MHANFKYIKLSLLQVETKFDFETSFILTCQTKNKLI